MVLLLALVIFTALAAATWHVSVACLRSTYPFGPDPTADPKYAHVAACAIGAAALTSFVPFPLGYVVEMIVWAVAVYGYLGLPGGRATVLCAYLAAAAVVSRLVILGVLSVL